MNGSANYFKENMDPRDEKGWESLITNWLISIGPFIQQLSTIYEAFTALSFLTFRHYY